MTVLKKSLLAATALGVGFGFQGVAFADGYSDGDLKRQLEELQKRIEELESQQAENTEALNTDVLRSTGTPGGYRIPGTNTTFRVGGYVKADFIYDFGEDVGESLGSPGIGDIDEDAFSFHARQTRLNIRSSTPTRFGNLTTLIETDFFGAGGNESVSNSFGMRLRHAWATLGGFGVGQFWSNFDSVEYFANTIDFAGPSGYSFGRHPQIRYTTNVSDALQLRFSIENPESILDGNTERANQGGINDPLDFTPEGIATAVYTGDGFGVRGSALVGTLSTQGSGDTDTDITFGFQVAGGVNLTEDLQLIGNAYYGDGISRRFVATGLGVSGGTVTGNNDVDSASEFGFFVGGSYQVTEAVSLNAYYGRAEALDNPGDVLADTRQTAHANIQWSPVARVNTGVEVSYVDIENAAGAEDDNVRLQAAVQVTF
ncbi:MAG: DcaP family trimeric outer membrane transporter [Pseudomonadota bacterium]